MEHVAYYTIEQASKILQLSQSSIYRGIKKGGDTESKVLWESIDPCMVYKTRI